MTINEESYKTITAPVGWQIELPQGWKQLEATALTDDVLVFCCAEDPTISMTWMLSEETDSQTIAKYQVLTMVEGPKSLRESQLMLNQIFPLIGAIKEASVIALKDFSRALETTESIRNEDNLEYKCGYQLTLRLNSAFHEVPLFQRLCFYAAVDEFTKWLPAVRLSARSFHYVTAYHPSN